MVSYYGYYSNASRGQRKKAGIDAILFCLFEPERTDFQSRITSPIRFIPWMPISEKPTGADLTNHARIGRHRGLFPIIFVLTADLPLGIEPMYATITERFHTLG